MNIFNKLKLSKSTHRVIEWEMTPDLAFCTYSAKGLRDELKNTSERICYFFIDNWGKTPRLYLMERGTRHVNILAEITAPHSLLHDCIARQGGTVTSRDNFSIDGVVKKWLIQEVIESEDCPYFVPMVESPPPPEDMGPPLPTPEETLLSGSVFSFPRDSGRLTDDQTEALIRKWNFFDARQNPGGNFTNLLTAPKNQPVIVDMCTALMWQQGGLELCSMRQMKKNIDQLNHQALAGHSDWRLPSLEEALSLMERAANFKGLHTAPCFSQEQPFIFVAARRTPTGYWFVDYKQGKVYWSSGTVPGGFARLCRNTAELL